MKFSFLMLLGFGLLIVMPLGCTSPSGPQTAPVAGAVIVDGEPLEIGSIVFENSQTKMALVYDVVDGKYKAASYQFQGLPPGEYDVAIKPITTDQPVALVGQESTIPPVTTKIPKKYFSTQTSGLKIEVEAGRKEPFNFEIKSK